MEIEVTTLERRVKFLGQVLLYTGLFNLVLVWVVGVYTLSWTEDHDPDVAVTLVKTEERSNDYLAFFDVKGLEEYFITPLTNKQYDILVKNSKRKWYFDRSVNPYLLDIGNRLPMFTDGVEYPKWYRILRPLVSYCQVAAFWLLVQLAVGFILASQPTESIVSTKGVK